MSKKDKVVRRVNPLKKREALKLPKRKTRDKTIVYSKKYQHGRSDYERDSKRRAKPSGKRKSKSGKIYYEYRINRTDYDDGI